MDFHDEGEGKKAKVKRAASNILMGAALLPFNFAFCLLIFVALGQVFFERNGDGRRFRGACLNVHMHAPFGHCLLCAAAKNGDPAVFLFEIWVIIEQRIDLWRAEKGDNIIFDIAQILQVAVDGAVHDGFENRDFMFFQKIDDLWVARVGARYEEFFILVFEDILFELGDAFQAIEHFPLAENDEFLKVIGDGFG